MEQRDQLSEKSVFVKDDIISKLHLNIEDNIRKQKIIPKQSLNNEPKKYNGSIHDTSPMIKHTIIDMDVPYLSLDKFSPIHIKK